MQALSGPDGSPLALPDEGLLISGSTAKKLQVGAGDEFVVETLLPIGPTRLSKIKIVGVHERFIGGASYLSLQQANRVIQEDQLISGAMLKTDAGLARQYYPFRG